ncbi:sigma-70 family RNA polymerase sigma factor [Caproiciproducens sp. NJN-50]|uniref:RNA polymerase sigma factor n=1 Tax=Caproiciproducens sp. NJN-50 TaxID=2507162 RepID=UPI000FFE2B2E|nr:sigma-70 family RNA polymerase sigma factor [Caproiciproducens sp. NJN-50]QAT51088.1 sigma-70 family RNA polymerase sigma factor [Caproiciproducens sp. NJN-50]
MKPEPLRPDDCAEKVIRFYADMVYRLAYARTGTKCDADEIFQEVFLRYIKKQPVFNNEEHRKAWMIRVTINCSNKLWNSVWKRKAEPLTDTMPFETKQDMDLSDELQQLPQKYREVIHLFYYENMSLEEISRALNRKNSTVRTQLTRARALLRNILKEDDDVQRGI